MRPSAIHSYQHFRKCFIFFIWQTIQKCKLFFLDTRYIIWIYIYIYIYIRRPKKPGTVFRTLLWSTVTFFFTLLDRASFPHYNSTKIIKFGWELFYLWSNFLWTVIFGFARFPEFRGTINDRLRPSIIERVLCSVDPCIALTRITIQARHCTEIRCSWLNASANTCVGACTCCWKLCH